MSEHLVTIPRGGSVTEGVSGLQAAVTRSIRAPDRVELRGTDVAYIFTPDLTANQSTRFDELVATLRALGRLEPEELDTIRPKLVALRTFRQMTPAAFGALTVAQRDTELFNAQRDLIDVLRAILRD